MPFIVQGKANVKYLAIVIILAVLTGAGAFLCPRNLNEDPQFSYQPIPATNNKTDNGSASTIGEGTKDTWTKEQENLFNPLTAPVSPSFIGNIQKTDKIGVSLFYDKRDMDFFDKQSIKNQQGQDFIFLPAEVSEKPSYIYSFDYDHSDSYPIFSSEGTHSYGGSALMLNDISSNFSINYIGLKMNDAEMIKNLKVEAVFSLRESGYVNDPSLKKAAFSWNKILGIEEASACGPSNITDPIGDSDLVLEKQEGDIYWYKLSSPINLYDLPIGTCYNDDGSVKENGSCQYCKHCADDCNFYSINDDDHYACEDVCNYDCFKWGGKLARFNIFYQPNGKEGFLSIQIANIILKDSSGNYFEPEFSHSYYNGPEYEGANYSYDAYLADKACFTEDGAVPPPCSK